MDKILCIVFLFIVAVSSIDGFASYMTRRHCEIPISSGVEIMGTITEQSDERVLKLYHGDIEITNGSTTTYSENLLVKVFPKINELVLEVSSEAKFVRGLCNGSRSNTNGAKMIIEKQNEYGGPIRITILGAWAKTYTGGVKIVSPFYFYYDSPAVNEEHNEL